MEPVRHRIRTRLSTKLVNVSNNLVDLRAGIILPNRKALDDVDLDQLGFTEAEHKDVYLETSLPQVGQRRTT